MSSVVVETLRAVFVADITKFQKSMQIASASAAKAAAKTRAAGKAMSLAVTLPLAIAGGALVKFASDAEEQASKLGFVFGDNAKDIEAWAKRYDAATRFGIESSKSLASNIGDFASSLGVSGSALTSLSTGVVQLSGDLASFKNVSQDQAFGAIQSALAGEREALKSLGIAINEAAVNQELLNLGVEGGSKKASAAQKAMATYNLIMKASENSIGDAARTSAGFANSLRGLQGRAQDAAVSLGQQLLPFATMLVNVGINLVGRFNSLSESTKKWTVGIAAAAAATGPLLFILGSLGSVLVAVFSPVGLMIAGTAAALVALAGIWQTWGQDVTKFTVGVYNTAKTWIQDKLGAIFDGLKSKIQSAIDFMKGILPDFVLEKIGLAQEKLGELGSTLTEQATKFSTGVVEGAKKFGSDAAEGIVSGAKEAFQKGLAAIQSATAPLTASAAATGSQDEQQAFGASDVAGAADPNKTDPNKSKGFLKSLQSQLKAVQSSGQIAADAISNIGNNMVDAALDGKNFGKAMGAMFKQLVRDILKAIVQQLILKALIGGDGEGGLFGKFAGGKAHGGTIPAGQFGLVGEQGPELINGPARITPIPKGSARGIGGTNVNVIINNNASGAEATAEEGTNEMGEKEIRVFIENTIANDIARNGPAARAMQQKFGARGVTVR